MRSNASDDTRAGFLLPTCETVLPVYITLMNLMRLMRLVAMILRDPSSLNQASPKLTTQISITNRAKGANGTIT